MLLSMCFTPCFMNDVQLLLEDIMNIVHI